MPSEIPSDGAARWARPGRLTIALALLAVGLICIVALLVLVPGKGPPIMAAIPEGDVLLLAKDLGELQDKLERSGFLARVKESAAVQLLERFEAWKELLERLRKEERFVRFAMAHLAGREVAVSAGREGWVAAFRIDTLARIAELLARRVLLRGKLRLGDESGVPIATLQDGVSWARLGDLLLASSSEEFLRRALRRVKAGGDGDPAGMFGLESLRSSPQGPRLAVRCENPAGMFDAGWLEDLAAALALPWPMEAFSVSLELRGNELLEESLAVGPLPLLGPGELFSERPEGTFLWVSYTPGRELSYGRLRQLLRGLTTPSSLPEPVLKRLLLPRLGAEATLALAEQPGLQAESGGFPAEFASFRLKGSEFPIEDLESSLRSWSLGVYREGDELPTEYPYLLKRKPVGAASAVYECVIRDARRREGYRPALALRRGELIYCSSLEALERFLDSPASSPAQAVRDEWLDLKGARVLELAWRAPKDLRQLKNAYDYLTELRRFSVSDVVADSINYEELWQVVEPFLREFRQDRIGVREAKGLRMRARWVQAN